MGMPLHRSRMQRAVQSSTGRPSNSSRAPWMVAFVTPAERIARVGGGSESTPLHVGSTS